MSKAKPLQTLLFAAAWFLAVVSPGCLVAAGGTDAAGQEPHFSTNGPVVYRLALTPRTNILRNSLYDSLQKRANATNTFSPEIIERLRSRLLTEPVFQTNIAYITNKTFDHLAPGWLNHMVWTNLIARTNGKSPQMWSTRHHPLLWPVKAPEVRWNTNCLLYGLKGFTGISPCWEGEGASGQVPITLLTRRHGYARGHGMGPEGVRRTFNGKRVWFVSADDTVVQVQIIGAVVRYGAGLDYTILLFDRDLPASIQPLTVISPQEMAAHYPWLTGVPPLIMQTEQEGRVSVDLPGFKLPVFKGGDSGSPDMIPLGKELVFVRGRTTSAPGPEMQADIDRLCREIGVDPKTYQMQWADLSAWPKFR